MKILIIEDNPDHLDLIEDLLHSKPFAAVTVLSEVTLESGKHRLATESVDVCLCDLNLPDSQVDTTVEWMTLAAKSFPVVTLTSLSSGEVADRLLSAGVQDYISKEALTSDALYRACRYAIERWKHQQRITEHNKDMQTFCSSLSHDFNGHINRIVMISNALQSDLQGRYELSDGDKRWFELLDSSTNGIKALVYNLHQYLTVEYSNRAFEKVDLSDVLQQAERSIRLAGSKSFTLHCGKTLPAVKGNHGLLQLMLQNLLNNSIKFCEQAPEITISHSQDTQSVTIIIADNGIGFDTSKAVTLFKPFQRQANSVNYPGTGLGLSIVKRIVEYHGGDISVASVPDEGSTFTISLPK